MITPSSAFISALLSLPGALTAIEQIEMKPAFATFLKIDPFDSHNFQAQNQLTNAVFEIFFT